MSLNSAKNQRNIKFKEHYFPNKQVTKKNSNQITIIPFVKLKDVWFSKEQNKVVSSMIILSLVIGLIFGLIFGLLIN